MDKSTKLKITIGYGITIITAVYVAVKGRFFLADVDGFAFTLLLFWALMVVVILTSSIILGTVKSKIKWLHPILCWLIFLAIALLVYRNLSFAEIPSTLIYPAVSIGGLFIGKGVSTRKQRLSAD
ncbi:MAG: hypothetical protein RR626_02435 [Anaerovoracaceae bacterium]